MAVTVSKETRSTSGADTKFTLEAEATASVRTQMSSNVELTASVDGVRL